MFEAAERREGKHSTAAVVHGLRAWRLLLLPSIIGERAPALSTLAWYQLLSTSVVGLRPLLDSALHGDAERTVHHQHALDGLLRRHWYRGAELGRIDAFSQFTATYAWTPPTVIITSNTRLVFDTKNIAFAYTSSSHRVNSVMTVGCL